MPDLQLGLTAENAGSLKHELDADAESEHIRETESPFTVVSGTVVPTAPQEGDTPAEHGT